MSGFAGKRGLVLGVANKRSIAWAIARRLADEGAELAFTFQGERIESSVRELAESVSSPLVTSCDVRSDDDLARVFSEVSETFGGGLDLLAVADVADLELAAELARELPQPSLPPREQHAQPAARGERAGDLRADAARSSGDNGDVGHGGGG